MAALAAEYNGPVVFGDTAFFNEGDPDPNELPPATPEDINREYSASFKDGINTYITRNNNELPYVNDLTKSELIGFRDQLYNSRTLPGTPEEIQAYLVGITVQIDAILDYTFRFE